MDFYQKINIPTLAAIQTETLEYFDKNPDLINHTSDSDYFVHVPLDQFPVLQEFLTARVKTRINETSINFVPPHKSTRRHIDGLRKDEGDVYKNKTLAVVKGHPNASDYDIDPALLPIANQFVLIIPIANVNESINHWYVNTDVADDDEIVHQHTREQYPYQFYISFVKDDVKLTPVKSTTLDRAAFIKSDVYHNVENRSDEWRMVFVIRFMEYAHYDQLGQVFDCEDIS